MGTGEVCEIGRVQSIYGAIYININIVIRIIIIEICGHSTI